MGHVRESPVAQVCWEDHPRGFSSRPCPVPLPRVRGPLPVNAHGAIRSLPAIPQEMPMEKLTAAMPRVYLPVSSALFHSFSADLHLPVVLVLHSCTEVLFSFLFCF